MHTQNYENIWNTYAKKFEKNSSDEKHLGDEWGTPKAAKENFEQLIENNLHGVKSVGELGVGGGKYTSMLGDLVDTIYGIDISDNMLSLTAERLEEKKCDFVKVKCFESKILMDSDSLDFFFSFDSMVHIFPYDFYGYMLEIGRILKTGAKAVIEFADWDRPFALAKFDLDAKFFLEKGNLNTGAFGFISRSAIIHFAGQSGLKVEGFEGMSGRTSAAILIRSE